jgi:hypothetical protein
LIWILNQIRNPEFTDPDPQHWDPDLHGSALISVGQIWIQVGKNDKKKKNLRKKSKYCGGTVLF